MPRIRTLKPEHRQHRKVGPLDHITYRLWVGMILEADDEGRLVYDPEALRVLIFGYHVKVTRALVEASILRLASLGLVNLYTSEGQDYACFPSWHDHQKIDRPRPSLLPSCEASSSVRRDIVERSSLIGKDLSGKDLSGKDLNTLVAAAPLARGSSADGFAAFWEAWPSTRRVGKADALKAWRALSPDPTLRQAILAAVEASKQRPDWQREGGRYISHPHRWLGKRRWEDAPPDAQATLLTEKTAGNLDAARRFVERAAKHREAP